MSELVFDNNNRTMTYKQYDKKYTTPTIFLSYRFNWMLCILSVLTSFVFVFDINAYKYVIAFDILFAMVYLFNAFVAKALYTSGTLNRVVGERSESWEFAKLAATITQSSVYRLAVPIVWACIMREKLFAIDLFWVYIIAAVAAGILFFSPYGIFDKERLYNHTAQEIYAGVLSGPQNDVSVDYLLRNNLDFKIGCLNYPELANNAYRTAVNKFEASAKKVKNELAMYDTHWRRALLFGDNFYRDQIPNNCVVSNFKALLAEHKENALALNKIIGEINAMPYERPTIRKKEINNESVFVKPKRTTSTDKPTTPKTNSSNDDTWGGTASWY